MKIPLQVIDIPDIGKLVGRGKAPPQFVPNEAEGAVHWGQGIQVKLQDGTKLEGVYFVRTSKGGGQMVDRRNNQLETTTLPNGELLVKQPNGNWLHVRRPQVSESDELIRKIRGMTNAPAAASVAAPGAPRGAGVAASSAAWKRYQATQE